MPNDAQISVAKRVLCNDIALSLPVCYLFVYENKCVFVRSSTN